MGLSPRGGGGNTVRNVTACPRAGVCPKEEFDVAPYAIATAEYLLQDRSSFNLLRKYKIVFSGCSDDCAFASVADLGFFAHTKNGAKAFSVYAAGGLGSNPTVAVKIEDFIGVKEVFEVAEAIKRLFDKHGDRANKHKARLRYVLARVGVEEFIKLYQKEREILKADGLPYESPTIRDLTPVGAGVMDVIKLDIDEAKDALKPAPANSENIYKAIVAAARALLVTFGLEPKKDREIFAAFTEHLIGPGWVKPQTQQLLDDAIDWRMGDRESIDDLLPQAEDLTKRVEELYPSLDANLQFKVEPMAQKTNADKTEANSHIIDLRSVVCPLNFVKAKLELEKIAIGEILEVLLDNGEPVRNAPGSFAEQGQEVMEVKNVGDYFSLKVRRKK